MILSRRELLVTMLGLPAAALVRPQANARPVAVMHDEIHFHGPSIDVDHLLVAMKQHPMLCRGHFRCGPRRQS